MTEQSSDELTHEGAAWAVCGLLLAVAVAVATVAWSQSSGPPTEPETIAAVWTAPVPLADEVSSTLITLPPPSSTTSTTSTTTTTEAPAPSSTTTTPPPVTQQPPVVVPHGDLEALICSHSWDCGTALRVARCESTMRPDAVGRAGERGLMQVHPVHRARIERLGYTWDQMLQPGPNLAVAHDLYREQGWRPWTCAR